MAAPRHARRKSTKKRSKVLPNGIALILFEAYAGSGSPRFEADEIDVEYLTDRVYDVLAISGGREDDSWEPLDQVQAWIESARPGSTLQLNTRMFVLAVDAATWRLQKVSRRIAAVID